LVILHTFTPTRGGCTWRCSWIYSTSKWSVDRPPAD
jgi:hypothetical protein